MPGGVALLDFDNDGRIDIFITNGAVQPELKKAGEPYWNRLFRNEGEGRFVDVTEAAGLAGVGYSMGAAAADFNNDGFVDLLVTGVHQLHLYRNNGNGRFEDVTDQAGLVASDWPLSAGWMDLDNNGLLDLIIVNYCRWIPEKEPFCGDQKAGYRTYCHPKFYAPLANQIFRNQGDGTFADVSKEAGFAARMGKGMAVAFADEDGDGRMDIFITNDTVPNVLYRNRGHLRFTESALAAGVAMNESGLALSSMGTDFRDWNNDGKPDIFFSALTNETFPLYRNLGDGMFKEVTFSSKIGANSLPLSGWSTGIYDFDNDGTKDIFVATGDVQNNTEVYSSRSSKQPLALFDNRGDGTFSLRTFGEPAMHRGAAFGDLNNDGWMDVVVTRLNQTPVVLYGVPREGRHWLRIGLTGKASNRDGLGTTIRVKAGGKEQWNHATTAVGYLSSSEKAVHFGLGAAVEAEEVEIRWPSGVRQLLKNVKADQFLVVSEP